MTFDTSGTPAPRQRLHAIIRGTVQGVGYRWFVQRVAARLELEGWVANRADRSVEVVAEGPGEALDALLASLEDGPPSSSVRSVDAHRGPAVGGLGGFRIRSGSHPGD
jgi:acylphosphatase